MPKVSVVIPVYRVESTLRRCVDSVLRQTFSDIQVILVDDGSPDSSGDICEEYARLDSRVQVIHKENGGISSARNAGLRVASGEYVMLLDSDDYLTDDALEYLLKGNADWIIGTVVQVSHTGTVTHQAERESRLYDRSEFADELPFLINERRTNYIHGNLYRRSLIEQHGILFEDDRLSYGEDTVFNFTFLPFCRSIYICGRPVHYYIKSAGGLASVYRHDRYQKSARLNDFIEASCESMGCAGEAVVSSINRRRVLSAVWCTDDISRSKDLSFQQKRKALAPIARDKRLKSIIGSVDAERKNEVILLQKKGPARYLIGKGLYKKFGPPLAACKSALRGNKKR